MFIKVKIPTATISSIKLKPLCFICFIVSFFYRNKKPIIFSPQKKEIAVPKIINGPKAILLFRPYLLLFKSISKTPATAPTQKDKVTAATPLTIPRSQPIPKASLASPKPIQRPRDTPQSKAKKANNIKPASKPLKSKFPISNPPAGRAGFQFLNKPANAKPLKIQTNKFGII